MRAVAGRTEASVANQKAIVQFSRPVASQRCPSRRTWRLVAPGFLRRKYKAQEPEASAEQGAARRLRQGNSAMTRGSGERSPALLNRFLAWGSQLSSHKSCSQERPPPGCSRWLGRPLPSRDKVSEPSYVPVTLARADLEVRPRPPSSSGARHSTMCSLHERSRRSLCLCPPDGPTAPYVSGEFGTRDRSGLVGTSSLRSRAGPRQISSGSAVPVGCSVRPYGRALQYRTLAASKLRLSVLPYWPTPYTVAL